MVKFYKPKSVGIAVSKCRTCVRVCPGHEVCVVRYRVECVIVVVVDLLKILCIMLTECVCVCVCAIKIICKYIQICGKHILWCPETCVTHQHHQHQQQQHHCRL